MYLYCDENSLTSLNTTGCTNLRTLECQNNHELAALNVSANTALEHLACHGDALTSLDLSANTAIQYLFTNDNQLTHILASIGGGSVEITAGTGGFVALNYDEGKYFYALADPSISFINWTNASDEEVSTMVHTDLTPGFDYDLTANFLHITGDPANGQIYVGGRITLTPSVTLEGGVWDYDGDALSRDGNTFTGLAVGTTRLAYGNGETEAYFDIVVRESELPQTGQDTAWAWVFIGAALTVMLIAAAVRQRNGQPSANNGS